MSNLAAIERARTVIDNQRDLLGVDVVQATLQALETQYAVLQATAVAPENSAQRKQVTVLFAHINGLSLFADATPGHAIMRLTRQLWQRLDSVFLHHGGYIDKHTSSTVMSVFGIPNAKEDDAERAIRAALDVRAEFRKFIAEIPSQSELNASNIPTSESPIDQYKTITLDRLQIQIGINSGLVLVDEVGRAAEYTVIGDSVNLASRLQQMAPLDNILIAQNSYQLVPDIFEVEQIGPISTKGKEELTQGYLIHSLKKRLQTAEPRNLYGAPVDFVGREIEFATLTQKWRDVLTTRQNRFLLVVGEAGIGKSRLTTEFWAAEIAAGTSYQHFNGRAEPRLRQTPFALLRYLFITTFNLVENEPTPIAREKVLQGMLALLPDDFELPPAWFSAVLQIIGLERDPFDNATLDITVTQHGRENIINATVEFWSAVAQHAKALLLVLEDLQWADDYSQRWVLELVNKSKNSALMIVGLTRPEFFESYPYWEITTQNLLGEHFHKLILNPLSPQASRQLVFNILEKLWVVPDDLYHLILERADGNPYYVEELIKVLVEDSVIVPEGRNWQLNQAAAINLRVPVTLTGVIQARLDNLPFSERITLQRAAVLGREFWQDALFDINRAAQRPLPEQKISTALQNLVRRDMLQLSSGLDLAGGQTFAFKHTLLHQVAYESVLLRERPLYHQKAAAWLLTHAGERLPKYAALIGGHLEQGADTWGAAQAFALAARHAGELSDFDGVIGFNQKALLLAGEPLHRLDWRLGVYRPLIEGLFMRARLQEAVKTAQAMAETAYKVGDMAAQVWVLGQITVLQREQSEFVEMLATAQTAEQIARLFGSGIDEVDALLCQAQAFLLQNKSSQALSLAERALALGRSLNVPQQICKSLYMSGVLRLGCGEIEQAHNYLTQLNQVVQQFTQSSIELPALASCQVHLWRLSTALDATQPAVLALHNAQQIYQQLEYQADLALTLDALGQAALLAGDLETAVTFFNNAVETAESNGNQYDGLTYRLNLAAANLKKEDTHAAFTALAPVKAFAQNPGLVHSWRLQARLNHLSPTA